MWLEPLRLLHFFQVGVRLFRLRPVQIWIVYVDLLDLVFLSRGIICRGVGGVSVRLHGRWPM